MWFIPFTVIDWPCKHRHALPVTVELQCCQPLVLRLLTAALAYKCIAQEESERELEKQLLNFVTVYVLLTMNKSL
jgi:hypothetical protein